MKSKTLAVLLTAFFSHPSLSLAAAIDLYDTQRVIPIEIEMRDWQALQDEWPAGGHCNWSYLGDQFQWRQAEKITVDGVSFAGAGIRKKSWCNSFSTTKPALKIGLGRDNEKNEDEAKAVFGTDDLVLNNSVEDGTFVRQCLVYELFRAQGLAAPLCNFAKVTINGSSYGIFVNIENMRKRFLKKHFGKPLGNLYEIAGDDIAPWAYDGLSNNRKGYGENDLADIKRLYEAIGRVDEDSLQLTNLLDLEQVIRYWSMEMMVTHWDGFALGLNNALMYFDEADGGRVKLLPWGVDAVLRVADDRATQLYASEANSLLQALYSLPEVRAKLKAEMERLNQRWDETAAVARVDEMLRTLDPHFSPDERILANFDAQFLRERIRARHAEMQQMIRSIDD